MKKPLFLFWSIAILGLSTAVAEELITWKKLQLTDQFYAEGACFGDLNQDGKNEIIYGPYAWIGPDFKEKFEIYEPKPFNINGYSDNFFSYVDDLNHDGWNDILVIGFPGKQAFWYANPQGKPGRWAKHLALAVVDNESPTYKDINNDTVPDIICSQNGVFGYAHPDPTDATKPWIWHPLSGPNATGGKFTHGLGIGDVNGDGRMDLLEKSRWWEQPESLDGDPVWQSRRTDFSGPGGAQMFAEDFDGDGDNDVVTSLQAHGFGLAWFEQTKRFENQAVLLQRPIMGQTPADNPYGVAFTQPHALDVADIDGDGDPDLITGKRFWAHNGRDPGELDPAVLYWFRGVQKNTTVEFVPYLIDDNSGVGTEVKAGDVNKDGLLDVVVGNKKGAFVHFQQREQVDRATWQKAQPMRTQIQGIRPMSSYKEGQPLKEAAAAMTLPEGFTSTLIAGEPDLVQPVTFCFDERGRIWVAEATTYPIPAAEGKGTDRILIFEDADHNGTFETRKVFADKLNLVSGLQVGFGGVWVGAAPYLLFIPDRNGDDVPDAAPEILLDGWGTQDTHETLNSFRWGPDGWLYGCHGVFTHSNVGKPGTPENQRTFLNCAVWRYHPTRHNFEVFAAGTSNPWGVDFDEYGQCFITACVIPHLWHMIQGAYYERQGGQHLNPHLYELIGTIARHRHFAGNVADSAHWGPRRNAHADVVPSDTFAAGGGHAHCGLTIYRGDNFPEMYRGALLMHNLHGHRINWDMVARTGTGYYGDRRPDFMFANDHWYVGTHLDYGPDGAVYTADWQDDTTCHRREELEWDKTNGRLYRIHFGKYQPVKIDLGKASVAELVGYHTHANEWYTRTARRVLQERVAAGRLKAEEVKAGLLPVFTGGKEVPNRLRALWTLHSVGALNDTDYAGMLTDASEYIRAWAIQLMGEDRQVSSEHNLTLAKLAESDPSAFVRRHLASVMQRIAPDQAWSIAENLAAHDEDVSDLNQPKLLWYGLEPLVAANPGRGLQLARVTKIPKLREFIYRRVASLSGGYETALNEILAANDPALGAAIVQALAAQLAGEAQITMPAAWPKVYDALKESAKTNAALQQNLFVLAGKFRDQRLLPEFRALVTDAQQSDALRLAALDTLTNARDAGSLDLLHSLVSGGNSPLRARAIASLALLNSAPSPSVLIGAYGKLTLEEKTIAITTLTSSPAFAAALLEGIGSGQVPRNDVGVVAARQILQFKDEALTASLTKHWGAVNPTSGDKVALTKQYTEKFSKANLAAANLGNGRRVYGQTCFACHTLFGQGMVLGPDLTGSNRGDLAYLLENILDPNALIGKDYQLSVFVLKDGRVVSGMVRQEGDTAFTVALPGGLETTVAKADVKERQTLAQSLMPEGILQALTETDARDLIAYLQSPKQVRVAQPGQTLLEGENLKIVKYTGQARAQGMSGFKEDSWSGDSQLWWTGGRPGDQLVLEFQVAESGTYDLATAFTKAHDYGQVRVKLDGKVDLLPQVDCYEPRPKVITTGELSMGKHQLEAGTHQLVVDILGANPAATKGYMFGIDYLSLVRQ